jgi:hypothetical protein
LASTPTVPRLGTKEPHPREERVAGDRGVGFGSLAVVVVGWPAARGCADYCVLEVDKRRLGDREQAFAAAVRGDDPRTVSVLWRQARRRPAELLGHARLETTRVTN